MHITAVLRIRIRIRIQIPRIHVFLGLLDPDPDPDPLVRGMDPEDLGTSQLRCPYKKFRQGN